MKKNDFAVYCNGIFEYYGNEELAIERAKCIKAEHECEVIIFRYFADVDCYFAIKSI